MRGEGGKGNGGYCKVMHFLHAHFSSFSSHPTT